MVMMLCGGFNERKLVVMIIDQLACDVCVCIFAMISHYSYVPQAHINGSLAIGTVASVSNLQCEDYEFDPHRHSYSFCVML